MPILQGVVETLPAPLEALVCTGDLQGIGGQDSKLLGEVLAEELVVLLEMLGISTGHTGILLSGDFYSEPQANKRGTSGDVRCVWNAFLRNFRWVAGVAGNHDQFGFTPDELQAFIQQPNLYYLDGKTQIVDGLKLAGVGGITGNPDKPQRRSAEKYLSVVSELRRSKPDILMLHLSPAVPELGYLGLDELGTIYRQQDYPLTICGHVSWPSPLAKLANNNQILNVDSRVVILTPSNV